MRRLTGLIALAAAVGCGIGLHRWYDKRHITADLRRTLVAAMDATATDADIRAYIRDARLHVHTAKDAALLSEFEQVVELGSRIDELKRDTESDDSLNAMRGRLGPGSNFERLLDIKRSYAERGLPVPKEVNDTAQKMLDDEKRHADERNQDVAHEYKEIQLDSDKATTLVADIRQQLELPPITSKK